METIDLLTKDSNLPERLSSKVPRSDPFVFSDHARQIPFFDSTDSGQQPIWDMISIQAFKNTEKMPHTHAAVRTFHSSGTSQTGILSSSHFTASGIDHYKFGALRAFKKLVLERLPHEAGEFHSVSIIPDSVARPNSSLSQMLSWFANEFPIVFCDPETDTRDFVSKHEGGLLFSTGLQLVDLFEHGFRARPNQYKAIFETGGSKGTTLQAESFELHDMIRTMFGDDVVIVSEYGMCELASQAYSVNRYDDLGRPIYQFLPENGVGASDGSVLAREGIGALVIRDFYRSDVPFAIRTQDKAHVFADGSFVLHGRLRKSPLKGCSLAFDRSDELPRKSALIEQPLFSLRHDRGLSSHQLLSAFSSARFEEALIAEVDGSKIASLTLKTSLQELGAAHFAQAVESLSLQFAECEFKPLLLAPNNHSLAVFHPLALLAGAGIPCSVRLPSNMSVSETILTLAHSLRSEGAEIHLVPNHLRMEDLKNQPWFDRVLVFGNDDTVKNIRTSVDVPVQCFGGVFASEFISTTESLNDTSISRVIESRQRGCLNTRVLFVSGDQSMAAFAADYYESRITSRVAFTIDGQLEVSDFWDAPAQQELRELDIAQGRSAITRFPVISARSLLVRKTPLAEILSHQPECFLPVIFGEHSEILDLVAELRSAFGTVLINGMDSFCENANQIPSKSLEPQWDGRHLNKILFAF
jgi:hypothetical protein